jgi:ATPase subunit of ABC transporter with duplicated ATPase domains
MVIVSHDREFLDNLCTKIVETERGVATTYKGNYTAYVAAKSEREALQWAAYERQQKEIEKLQDLVRRLSGEACSGDVVHVVVVVAASAAWLSWAGAQQLQDLVRRLVVEARDFLL